MLHKFNVSLGVLKKEKSRWRFAFTIRFHITFGTIHLNLPCQSLNSYEDNHQNSFLRSKSFNYLVFFFFFFEERLSLFNDLGFIRKHDPALRLTWTSSCIFSFSSAYKYASCTLVSDHTKYFKRPPPNCRFVLQLHLTWSRRMRSAFTLPFIRLPPLLPTPTLVTIRISLKCKFHHSPVVYLCLSSFSYLSSASSCFVHKGGWLYVTKFHFHGDWSEANSFRLSAYSCVCARFELVRFFALVEVAQKVTFALEETGVIIDASVTSRMRLPLETIFVKSTCLFLSIFRINTTFPALSPSILFDRLFHCHHGTAKPKTSSLPF